MWQYLLDYMIIAYILMWVIILETKEHFDTGESICCMTFAPLILPFVITGLILDGIVYLFDQIIFYIYRKK